MNGLCDDKVRGFPGEQRPHQGAATSRLWRSGVSVVRVLTWLKAAKLIQHQIRRFASLRENFPKKQELTDLLHGAALGRNQTVSREAAKGAKMLHFSDLAPLRLSEKTLLKNKNIRSCITENRETASEKHFPDRLFRVETITPV